MTGPPGRLRPWTYPPQSRAGHLTQPITRRRIVQGLCLAKSGAARTRREEAAFPAHSRPRTADAAALTGKGLTGNQEQGATDMLFISEADQRKHSANVDSIVGDGTTRRVAALRATGLLDTPAEERFDRLTRLARHMLRTPVALVSLLDADRQFFLSAQGLPEPFATQRETPLPYSICRLVVESGLPLAVEDARNDPRTRGHLAIEALGVVAYLAMPLALPDGCVIGTLCVVDLAPRPWSAEDQQAMADLSGAVMAEFAAGLQLCELDKAGAALRKSEAFLRSMLDASADCIKVIERDGTLSFINGQGQCALEIDDAGTVIGMEWAMFWPPDAQDQVRAAVANGLAGVPIRFEAFCPTAKGTPRWWDVSVAPIAGLDDVPARLIAVSRDITERKRTEAELRGSEERLRELQAELLHVSRLSAAGEMASSLAHELNQPLTAIASAVKAAQRMLTPSRDDAAVEADLREAMDLTAGQALRAGQIIRRLRDFVTREGEVEKRMEDLSKLAEDAGALALLGAKERGVRVGFRFAPQLPRVLVDRIQIQQVILNLMRNALEAMAPEKDGTPRRRELTLEARPAGPGMVEVDVADTGPGLAPEVADCLFTPFVSTKKNGMGMGLVICRSIIEAHGGRLWAEPNSGGGAVFRFTLPAGALDAKGGYVGPANG